MRSEVAKRPPSSGTSGRSSGGITGTTSRIIHSGRLFDSMKASISFSRLTSFLRRASESVSRSSSRSRCFSSTRSIADSIVRSASAPIDAVNWSSPYSSCAFMQLFFAEQLVQLQRRQAGLDDDVVLEIEDALEILQRHVEQQADAARQRLQEPDMRHRRGQLDMAHAVAPHLRQA